jgi:hypothetical protein
MRQVETADVAGVNGDESGRAGRPARGWSSEVVRGARRRRRRRRRGWRPMVMAVGGDDVETGQAGGWAVDRTVGGQCGEMMEKEKERGAVVTMSAPCGIVD